MKKWYEVIREDWPDFNITEKTIETTVRTSQSERYSPLSTRFAMGRIWTDKDYNERRQRVLNTPLP